MDNRTDLDLSLPGYVRTLMERLEGAGEEVYLVGGSLRDALLGIPPHDFDLATSALPQKTVSLFSDLRVIETGLKHGTVTVLSQGNPVEITTFRIDGSYTDARHPDGVTFTDRITDDLSRRDFTVNAMAYSPRRGLVDPFGGRQDLARRVLRAVGEPERRFSEDALRIMRAFRFSAQLGFAIDPDTLLGATRCRAGLARIAAERIAAEFLRLLLSPDPAPALAAMTESGILPYVSGDYRPSEKLLATLASAPCEDVARLGLFLAEADEAEATALLRRLKYSNKQLTGARAVRRGSGIPVSDPAQARRLIADCGVYAPSAVRASVLLGNSPREAIGWVERNSAACSLRELALSGKDLLAAGIEGRRIGVTLERLLAAVLEDPSLNQRQTLLALALAQNQPNQKDEKKDE
ncbi:MAG: hypothetical protein IJW44_01495 [Clostridia bacterium]|nr:hypothetical protein [Clostridia bacterium]